MWLVLELEQHQGRVLHSQTAGSLPHPRARPLPRCVLDTIGNTADSMPAADYQLTITASKCSCPLWVLS